MALPLGQDWPTSSTKWKSQIDPILVNPLTAIHFLPNLSLISGVNNIAHGLSRTPIGWVITDVNAAITIYRSAPFNSSTLQLTTSGVATVTIGVF